MRTMARNCTALLLALALSAALPLAAQQPAGAGKAPVFEQKFLRDPGVIETGRKVWDNQCRHCHGAAAYPGKAPKLDPGQLDPDFIYDRVTNGFRKMPAWKDVFSEKERMAVAAYIKSAEFSP
jgi:mono/diheme cytochrome c family protein